MTISREAKERLELLEYQADQAIQELECELGIDPAFPITSELLAAREALARAKRASEADTERQAANSDKAARIAAAERAVIAAAEALRDSLLGRDLSDLREAVDALRKARA